MKNLKWEFIILGSLSLLVGALYLDSVAGPELERAGKIFIAGLTILGSVFVGCLCVVLLGRAYTKVHMYGHEIATSLRESEVETVIVKEDETLFIRDSGRVGWHNTDLDPRAMITTNGPQAQATEEESERWAMLKKFKFMSRIKFSGRNDMQDSLMMGEDQGIQAPMFLPENRTPPPNHVDLLELLGPQKKTTVNDLILGVSYDAEIIRDGLKNLTHIAIAGSTRWGKSIFIQSLLYQMALAREDVVFYLADLGGNTFIDFGMPYADSLEEAEVMVFQVMREAEHRKDLYKATGRGIKSLDMYNALMEKEGGQTLPWGVMIIDEALYLMEKSKQVKNDLEIAVSWAAKYGITCILVSQDFKSNVIQTSTRNNFSTRFQFLAEDKTQAGILIAGSEAHLIENRGRCVSRLPGNRSILELQTPFIHEDKIIEMAPVLSEMGGFNPDLDISDFVEEEIEDEPAEIKAKYHPDNINNAIDELIVDRPDTFPSKKDVSKKVGISGGSKYSRVMGVYNKRLEVWNNN